MTTVKYTTDNTSVLVTGQFTKTVASSGTPEKLWPGIAQIFTVQAVADTAGSLRGTYFDCQDSAGLVRVWFTVGATGTAPALATGRLLVVNVTSGDSANTVASALNTVIDAEAEFVSTVLTDMVTVTQVSKGERGAPSAGTSGFTVGVSTAGVSTKLLVPSVSFTGRKARGTNNTGIVYWGQSSTNDTQLKMLTPGETVSLFAPEGGSINLGQFYLDVVTAADGVIVAYPATQPANAAVGIDQSTPGATNATQQKQYTGVPSTFTPATADATVFTLAAGEVGFIQNLSSDAPLAVKKGATASTSSFNFVLAPGTATDDGKGGAVSINDWVGAVSVAKVSGTARYIAYKQVP